MIKAVLFDFGGVLSEGGKAGAIRQIFARAYGLGPNELRFEHSGLMALKGQLTDDEFIATMNERHRSRVPATKEDFIAAAHLLMPCTEVYDLAADLRAHGIRTGIASNVLCMAVDVLRTRGLYESFEPVLLSCEIHAAKPEPEFYAIALERLGLRGNEVLFIDDQERFMPPVELGVHTILAVSPQQIVEDTKAIIQKENNLTLE